jgi:hypothetical protein
LPEAAGTVCHEIAELGIRVASHRFCDRAVIDQCYPIATTVLYMIIKGIITGVEDAALKPAVKRGVIARKDPIRGMVPLNVFCSSAPESFRVRY